LSVRATPAGAAGSPQFLSTDGVLMVPSLAPTTAGIVSAPVRVSATAPVVPSLPSRTKDGLLLSVNLPAQYVIRKNIQLEEDQL